MPVTSAKALSSLACTRGASSSQVLVRPGGAGLHRPALDRRSRPGLDDSRASQAMRWCVLRAAFHCGPEVRQVGLVGLREGEHQRPAGRDCDARRCARRKAGATRRVLQQAARASALGTASSTASKPEYTWLRVVGARGAQLPARAVAARRARCARRACRARRCPRPAAAAAQWRDQRVHAGRGDPVRLRARAGAASATRPCGSSTRTVLALQGLHSCGAVSSARCEARVAHGEVLRAVVEACRRASPRWPCGRRRRRFCSNTVTRWPACTSVRAQAMPAMPAPTTAMWRGAGGFGGGRSVLRVVMGSLSVDGVLGGLAATLHRAFSGRWCCSSSARARAPRLSSCASHHCSARPGLAALRAAPGVAACAPTRVGRVRSAAPTRWPVSM